MLESWHLWVIGALVFAISEIFIAGFAVACLSVGALASAVIAYLGFSLVWQLSVFGVGSLAAALLLRPVALTLLYNSSPESATNVDAIIGKRGKVVEEIPGNSGKGRVKVESEEWSAISEIDLPIPVGTYVVVKRVEGNKLIVEVEKE